MTQLGKIVALAQAIPVRDNWAVVLGSTTTFVAAR